MGLFNKLFSGSTEEREAKALPWIPLTQLEQLEEIKAKSTTKTQVIFKHSTRCGISRMVIKQFETDFNFTNNNLDLYYLDLLEYRDISNEIANSFQVIHESPQLLVIKNGVVVTHVSHGSINDMNLSRFM